MGDGGDIKNLSETRDNTFSRFFFFGNVDMTCVIFDFIIELLTVTMQYYYSSQYALFNTYMIVILPHDHQSSLAVSDSSMLVLLVVGEFLPFQFLY